MRKILVGTLGLLLAAAVACPAQVGFTQYPVSNGVSEGITAGPDGNLWFVESSGRTIGRMTPGGVITEFTIPFCCYYQAAMITAGPDGNLWFTGYFGQTIGKITPTGVITQFDIQIPGLLGGYPYGITAGADGNLWFVESVQNKIGRITPAGVITHFPIPGTGAYYGGTDPWNITSGPDGNVWFTEFEVQFDGYGNRIGRITPAGVITEFPVPTSRSGLYGITAGPDGNLWFTEFSGNKIGRITPAGLIMEFPIPTDVNGRDYITTGPDGNLWFTEQTANKLGRITLAGVITEFSIPPGIGGGSPTGITLGPDGNLWFADGNAIVKANIPGGTQLTVFPNAGGNTGNVTVQLFGRLQTGATVKLTGVGPDIVGSNANVSNGSVLTATFNLTGALPGPRTVVLTNPDTTSVSLPGAFTVEQGGAPDIWIDLIGRSFLRGGQDQTFYLVVGNRGTIDGTGITAWVSMPDFISLTGLDENTYLNTFEASPSSVSSFDIGAISASTSKAVSIVLRVPDSPEFAHRTFQILNWVTLQ